MEEQVQISLNESDITEQLGGMTLQLMLMKKQIKVLTEKLAGFEKKNPNPTNLELISSDKK